jgi:copper chaperone CopZ
MNQSPEWNAVCLHQKQNMKIKLFLFTLIFLICPPSVSFGAESEQSKEILLQQFQLKVSGLKCKSCIPDVRKALKKVPGVRDARITKFDKSGSVTLAEVVPKSASGDQLVRALKEAGFQAEIIFIGEPRMVRLEKESSFSLFGLFN